MKFRKRILSCAMLMTLCVAISVQAQQNRQRGEGRGQGQGGQGRERMAPEERAKIAKAATPLVAQGVATFLKLSKEGTKKFTTAYVAESQAAQKRSDKAREAGAEGNWREVYTENREKMQEVLKSTLSEEQAKKAGTVLGGFNSLDRSVQGLLMAKVAKAKVKKALPVLIKYAAEQGALFAKMRAGEGERPSREDMMAKFTEIREKMTKELTPIIGEEAAAALQQRSGTRGSRGPGGGGQGQGNRQREGGAGREGGQRGGRQ